MIYVPFIAGYMLVSGVLGLILIAIGRAFPWVLLATFLFLCTQVSFADEIKWQLVFIKDGEIVVHGDPHEVRRDCIRLGYMYMQTALNEHEDPQLDGFLCDRVPPLPPKTAELPVCTEPIEQCS